MSLILRHVGGTIIAPSRMVYHEFCRAMFSSWREPACRSIMSEPFFSSVLTAVTQSIVVDRHAVVPKHFRIVATARYISPENYAT